MKKMILVFGLVLSAGVFADHWTSRKDVETSAKTLQGRCASFCQAGAPVPYLTAFVRDVERFAQRVQDIQSGASYKAFDRLLADFKVVDENFKQLSKDFAAIEKSRTVDVQLKDYWISSAVAYQYLWRSMTSGLPFEQIEP